MVVTSVQMTIEYGMYRFDCDGNNYVAGHQRPQRDFLTAHNMHWAHPCATIQAHRHCTHTNQTSASVHVASSFFECLIIATNSRTHRTHTTKTWSETQVPIEGNMDTKLYCLGYVDASSDPFNVIESWNNITPMTNRPPHIGRRKCRREKTEKIKWKWLPTEKKNYKNTESRNA